MEKKKLVESLSKSYKANEECLDQGYFLTTEDDQSTAKLVKLYDKFVVIHTNAGKIEPWGRINFDFDLVFEAVRSEATEDKRTQKLKGIKF